MSPKILSPEGRVGLAPAVLAPSPEVLAGLRIAVLDNGKPGAELLMGALSERIGERSGARITGVFRKGSAATPCEPELLAELVEQADLVVTGTAD
jgi:trimethylamine:corrinoid methyltransferase-like protein